jgi:hypothetical protein
MKWESGRQDATQSLMKLKIWSRWNTDCYLLKFKEGSVIDEHLDPVEGKKHYRLNITLYGMWNLFTEWSNYGTLQRMGSHHLFRPDITKHSADILTDCMILSLGIAL